MFESSQVRTASAATVRKLMRADVVTAVPHQSLAGVADRMRAAGIGAAAVLDGGELVGILTERDLVRAMTARSGRELRVGEYMTPEPCTVGPDVDAREAAGIMAERGFRHLPVVEEGRIIGFISSRNLLELERRLLLRSRSPGSPGRDFTGREGASG